MLIAPTGGTGWRTDPGFRCIFVLSLHNWRVLVAPVGAHFQNWFNNEGRCAHFWRFLLGMTLVVWRCLRGQQHGAKNANLVLALRLGEDTS
jgi:hypothetical protein